MDEWPEKRCALSGAFRLALAGILKRREDPQCRRPGIFHSHDFWRALIHAEPPGVTKLAAGDLAAVRRSRRLASPHDSLLCRCRGADYGAQFPGLPREP